MLLGACCSIVFSLVSAMALIYALESTRASTARPYEKNRDMYSNIFFRLGLSWKTTLDIALLRLRLSQT